MSSPITVHHLSQHMAEFATKAQKYREVVEEIRGQGRAGEGLVTATADFTGTVTGLHIDARAMRLDSFTLTDYLLEAIAAAQRDAKDRAAEASKELSNDARAFAKEAGVSADLDAMARSLGSDPQQVVQNALDKLRRM
jgi:DNA-binding protein YbaB